MEPPRKQLLEQAQALERRGDQLGAAQAFARAGSHEDAARLFLALARYANAGQSLLRTIEYDRRRLMNMDSAKKKVALKAAICFSKAGDIKQAVELFLAAGERSRAVEMLQEAGDFVNAARVEADTTGRVELVGYRDEEEETKEAKTVEAAHKLEQAGKFELALEAYLRLKQWGPAAELAKRIGRLEQAAGYYAEGGLIWDAASCYREVRDTQREFELLIKLPHTDPHYREACVRAIYIASNRAELSFELEHFLSKFTSAGLQNDSEIEACYQLALLFENHDFPENAAACYRKLLAVRPGYRDAPDRLKAAETDYRGAAAKDYERVFKEELAFRDSIKRHETPIAGLPELGPDGDELPELPDLPDLPGGGLGPDSGGDAAVVGHARTMMSGPVHVSPRGVTPAPVQARPPAQPGPGAPAYGRTMMPVGGRGYPVPPGYTAPPGYPAPPPGYPVTPAPVPGYPTPPGSHPGYPVTPAPVPGHPVTPAPVPGYPAPPGAQPGYATPNAAYPAVPSMASGVPVPVSGEYSGLTPAPAVQVVLEPGAVINQRYQLEKKIGQGGMGAVFKAKDLELDEIIAVKFLSAQLVDDEALSRFKQEVSLSRQFNHPNIIRLYDIGTCGDHKYITMELLSGHDLGKLMEQAPLDFDRGLALMVQACNALQIVHDRGVIHRDIKPDNFFITEDGVLKVMDFGIAKHHNASRGLTRAGMMAGTPQYMAPEQANNFGGVTFLADIYALGCIAYQIFTGTVPFDAEEIMPILIAHMATPPDPPSSRNPAIFPELEAVILKLLSKRPEERVQSCHELAAIFSGIRLRLPPKPKQ